MMMAPSFSSMMPFIDSMARLRLCGDLRLRP
jgi:hypothetical protein